MITQQILYRLDKFDKSEVYVEDVENREFELKNSKNFSKESSLEKGCGIKLIKNSKSAFAYLSLNDKYENNIDSVIYDALNAIELSKNIDVDIIPPISDKYSDKGDLNLDEDMIKDKIYDMDKIARNSDKRIIDVKGVSMSASIKKFQVANSFGLSVEQYRINESFGISVLAEYKSADMGWYAADSSDFSRIDFENVVHEAVKRAIDKLYPVPIETGKYEIVLSKDVAMELLSHYFDVFNAYSSINHTTMLSDRIGDKIFSECVNIVDSPVVEHRPNSVIYDDEGVKRDKKRYVVKNGVFNGFLHNTYTANKLSMENTGNAKRTSYSALPKVGPSNFYIEPSGLALEQIFNGISKGMYITDIMGLHMANTISGDFSLGINGFLIKNGNLGGYFKAASFAGNFFDIMSRVYNVSNSYVTIGSFGSCDLHIGESTIGSSN